MSMRVEDLGELAYGGLVAGLEQYDKTRLDKGEITDKDVFKKFGTYGYLVPGVIATGASAFGFMRRYETWLEHVQHGFIYDFPRWLTHTITTMTTEGNSSGASARRRAVAEAKQILSRNQIAGTRETARTYQPEFESVAPNAF